MRRVCVIGAGRISKVYAEVLASGPFEISYVDPKFTGSAPPRCYSHLNQIPAAERQSFDLWIIAAPTHEHGHLLAHVLGQCPWARILSEKPLVPISDFPLLMALVRKFPDCRILENCQYEQSALFERILALAPEIFERRGEIRRIYIEFTKNRVEDDRLGRARDLHYSLLGYEGPHLIGLAERIVSRLFGKSILEQGLGIATTHRHIPDPRHPDEGTGRFDLSAAGLPAIELYTSMIGEIGDKVLMPEGQASIGVGDARRYRLLRFDFGDRSIAIRLEPNEDPAGAPQRNVQLIHAVVENGRTDAGTALPFHIFSDAVHANVQHLASESFDTHTEMERSLRKLLLLERLTTAYRSDSPPARLAPAVGELPSFEKKA